MKAKARAATFKRLVMRAAILPVLLLLALAAILVWQVQQLLDTTALVERSDLILTSANELQRLYVDMESGLRGYLITDNFEFLEPFERGASEIPKQSRELESLISSNPRQAQILARIESNWEKWRDFAESELELRHNDGDWKGAVALGAGKARMDEIRHLFSRFLGNEEQMRADRVLASRRAATTGSWIACGAALIVGAILALLARRELQSLAKNYETSLRTAEQLAADLEQRVADRTAALSDVNRELEAFAYSISHDLRAPLRHIGGFGDLLKRSLNGTLSDENSENLEVIIDTSKQAGRMVDDLLAFSRIGRAELRRDSVDLNAIVERCRHELGREAGDREIIWSIGDLPKVMGDSALLKLAMTNLLSNAVKYTANVEPAKIEVSAAPEGDGTATFIVRDNGVGFDMAYSHKLFGVFQRLHRAEDYEGTGIGLANVRRIINRHGGRVWAEGRLGDGAEFYFTLPLAEKPNARGFAQEDSTR